MAGPVRIAILADARKAVSGVRETKRELSTLGAIGRKINGALSAGLVAGAAAGVAGLAVAVKTGVSGAVAYEKATRQANAALTALKGTTDETVGSLKRRAAAIETVSGATIDENDALKAQTTLMRAGAVSSKVLDEALKASANVATARGTSIDAASTVIAKALAKPEAAAGKLARSGVILSDAQQKQIEAFVKAGEAAKAQGVILDALEKKYKGSAAAAGDTLAGKLGRLRDAFEDATRDLALKALPGLTAFVEKVGEKLPGVLDRVSRVMPRLKAAFSGAPRVLEAFAPPARVVWDILKKISSAAGTATVNVGKLLTKMGVIKTQGPLTGHPTGRKTDAGAFIGIDVSKINFGELVGKLIVKLGQAIKEVDWFSVGQTAGSNAVPFTIGFVANMLDPAAIADAFMKHKKDFTIGIASLLTLGIGGAFGKAAGLLEKLPFGKVVSPIFKGLDKAFGELPKKVARTAGTVGGKFFDGLLTGIGKAAPKAESRIRGFLDDIGIRALVAKDLPGKARTTAGKFVDEFPRVFGQGVGRVTAAVGRLANGITNRILRIEKSAQTAGARFMQRLIDRISASRVGQAVGRIVTTVGNRLRGLATKGAQAGRDLVTGFVNGIRGAIGSAASAAADMASSAINAAKSRLHIGSPSKVFQEIGRFVATGFVIGLTGSRDEVRTAILDLVGQITEQRGAYLEQRRELQRQGIGQVHDIEDAKEQLRRALEKPVKTSAQRDARATAVRDARKALAAATKDYRGTLADLRTLDKDFAPINTSKKVTALQRLILQYAQAFEALAAQREDITERLEAANDQLQQAIDLRDGYIKSLADQTKQFASLGSLDFGADSEGNKAAPTSGGILSQLRTRLTAIKDFGGQVKQLITGGVNNNILQQVLDSGVETGSQFAKAILEGGAGGISELNDLQAQITLASQELGVTGGNALYQSGVDSAQGLVDGLKSQQAILDQTAVNLALQFKSVLQKNLKLGSGAVDIVTDWFNSLDLAAKGLIPDGRGGRVHASTVSAASVATSLSSSGSGRTATLNVNVNGSGAEAEAGRRILQSIEAYTNLNGPVKIALKT